MEGLSNMRIAGAVAVSPELAASGAGNTAIVVDGSDEAETSLIVRSNKGLIDAIVADGAPGGAHA